MIVPRGCGPVQQELKDREKALQSAAKPLPSAPMSDEASRGGGLAKPVPLSRFRAALARPAGTKRLEALISADDAMAQVQALGVPDLYFLIKDIGIADSYDLLALASSEQVQGCLDLDSWERDRPQLEGIKPWLAAVQDAGFEKLGEVWQGLDPELCALLLSRWAHIWDHSLGEEPDDSVDGPLYKTPDTFFTLKVISEREDDVAFIFGLLEDLYRADGDVIRRALMAARSEPVAELEEYAYRWRSGRMADLGYVDFYDALEVFRPLDAASVQIGEGTADVVRLAADTDRPDSNLPVPMVEQVVGRAFLARALDSINEADEASRLESALLILVNKVLAAAKVSPGDEDAIAVGTEHATATLALGLETVSGGDLERAAEALKTIALSRLHRVGYTVTLRLSRLARAVAGKARSIGEPTQSVLKAVLRSRPFFPLELEVPPGQGLRPFESTLDLQRVATHLAQITFRIAIAETLGINVEALADAPEPKAELDDYLRTAMARGLLDRELDAAALTGSELREILAGAFEDGRIVDTARTHVATRLAGLLDEHDVNVGLEHLPRLVQAWLDELQDELGGLGGGDVDPRFVSKVLLSATRS